MYSVRQTIIPHSRTSRLISIDLKNIEYRLLAHFSKEPKLIKLFSSGGDFHSWVASYLFDVKIEKVTKEQRNIAKTFNFSMIYGSSDKAMATKLGLPLHKVRAFIHQYKKTFPCVAEFIIQVNKYCHHRGGIRNPFGRWRDIPPNLAYTGPNTLIQSTAADILKLCVLRVNDYLRKHTNYSKLLFSVHDELVINWDLRDGDIVHPICELMEKYEINGEPMFRIPIEVDVAFCYTNWGIKIPYDFRECLQAMFAKTESLYETWMRFHKEKHLREWFKFFANHSVGVTGEAFLEILQDFETALGKGKLKLKKFLKNWMSDYSGQGRDEEIRIGLREMLREKVSVG